MSGDFEKGRFSHGAGPGQSHGFQQGVWARQADERRAREAAERAARERDEALARQVAIHGQRVQAGTGARQGASRAGAGHGLGAACAAGGTLDAVARSVKNGAFVGVVLFLVYAFTVLPKPDDAWLPHALAGGVVGAVAGGVLHVALILLRWALVVLAWAFGLLLLAGAVGGLWDGLWSS